MELTSVEGRSKQRLAEAVNKFNESMAAVEDVISGRDTASILSHEFNQTLDRAIGQAQNETSSLLEQRMSNRLQAMRRALASTPAPQPLPAVPGVQQERPISDGVDGPNSKQAQPKAEHDNIAQDETGKQAQMLGNESKFVAPAVVADVPQNNQTPKESSKEGPIIFVDVGQKASISSGSPGTPVGAGVTAA